MKQRPAIFDPKEFDKRASTGHAGLNVSSVRTNSKCTILRINDPAAKVLGSHLSDNLYHLLGEDK